MTKQIIDDKINRYVNKKRSVAVNDPNYNYNRILPGTV